MSEGLDRFAALKDAIAKKHNLPSDSRRVRIMAALDLAEERLTETIAAGHPNADYSALAKIIELRDRYTPPEVEPWAALLPGLDSTPMGWRRRDWFLGEHAARLFDRTGNIGPSLWWNGRIVGGWAQDRDGQIVCRFLEDVGADAVAVADAAAQRLAKVVGTARLAPRTRCPGPSESASCRRRA